MKARFLFPPVSRIIGLCLAVPGFVVGYLYVFQGFRFTWLQTDSIGQGSLIIKNTGNLTDEVALTGVIIGLVLIAFSKLKKEDELTASLRMNALYWSILANLLLCFGMGWLDVDVYTYNLFSPLVIFILRFNYLLYSRKDRFVVPALRLLPYKVFRPVGVVLTVIGFAGLLGCLMNERFFFDKASDVSAIVLFAGLVVWTFSRNRHEDELTMQHRLESMYLAVLFNSLALLVATFTVYGFGFLFIMSVNLCSTLFFFVLRFAWVSYRNAGEETQQKGGLLV